MEVRVVAKSVRMSPRKVRLVADAIRKLPLQQAMISLQLADKRAAMPLMKALKSAVANAVNNAKLDLNDLQIASIMVNEAPALKRFHPSTRGRVHPYKRRGSHITIVLQEKAKVSVQAQPVAALPAKIEKKEGKK